MLSKFKRAFYFPVAWYFRFFASIQLALWKPRIIVITGSSGKTTLLHLIESQLGEKARYSHHANSSFGIPFDILGLKRENLLIIEWISLFFLAPFKAFKKPFKETIYIAEADCDRPKEGAFLASILRPEVTLWVSSSRTHSMNFDSLVPSKFKSVEEAISYEFGYFLAYTKSYVVINGDSSLINSQVSRTKAKVVSIRRKELESYALSSSGADFKINGSRYSLKALLPEEAFYALEMTKKLMEYLNLNLDPSFPGFTLPPGRSSVFKGIKDITIIDSSYNAALDSMKTILKMFSQYSGKEKWIVLGDMIEQGKEEEEEHKKLAEEILKYNFKKIVLMGPRVSEYTYPKLKVQSEKLHTPASQVKVVAFLGPKEVLEYLEKEIKGGETVLFKGARFLEGVIERLLLNKEDAQLLCRREKVWEKRRKKWGL